MLDSFEPGFLLECCGVRELQAPEKCNENIKRYKLSFRPLSDKFTKKLTPEFKRPKFTRLYLFSFVRVRISMNRFLINFKKTILSPLLLWYRTERLSRLSKLKFKLWVNVDLKFCSPWTGRQLRSIDSNAKPAWINFMFLL